MTAPHLQTLIDRGTITVDANGTVRLTKRAWLLMTGYQPLHFVGFKDDRYWNAVRVFGKPDYVHRFWDVRASQEIAPGDRVVFAEGDETQSIRKYAYDDSANF